MEVVDDESLCLATFRNSSWRTAMGEETQDTSRDLAYMRSSDGSGGGGTCTDMPLSSAEAVGNVPLWVA